jgi:hypothetical protein
MDLHFLHMYCLSYSIILTPPDLTTVPLSVISFNMCFTLTFPILGDVSAKDHRHQNQESSQIAKSHNQTTMVALKQTHEWQ